jgi:two-component system, cell cycle sensor histidine kinase and response regulator CckA
MGQSAKLDVRQLAVLAFATLLSLAILWFSTGNIILVGSCAAVIIAAGALIHFFRHTGSVEDSGVGISKENLSKIFEPFFTTKELGHGTGLGLSTVYGIVKQSGAFIFADSTVGQGTRFDIFLPVHQGEATVAGTGKKEFYKPKDLWGSGRVLIVEDEDMVRAVAERALVRQGYVVETASDGEQALELFAEGKRYDLIVSDVVMPNMDGPTMARNLRETISLDNVSFLAKPFSVQQIAEAVHDALMKAN